MFGQEPTNRTTFTTFSGRELTPEEVESLRSKLQCDTPAPHNVEYVDPIRDDSITVVKVKEEKKFSKSHFDYYNNDGEVIHTNPASESKNLTVKNLKEMLNSLPDDMEVIFPHTDDSDVVYGFYNADTAMIVSTIPHITDEPVEGNVDKLCITSKNIKSIYEHLGLRKEGSLTDMATKVLF